MISVDKINIAFASGSFIEKPLISAFKGVNGNYVVLDNEINGAMGLPIILVTKYTDNKFEKITDQNEWNAVKEYLRNIISGNQMDYIKVTDKVTADENFFLQLTLPVASFESLKANYKPIEGASESTPVAPATPASPAAPVENTVEPAPVMPNAPTPTPAPEPVQPEPASQPVEPTPPVTPTPIPTEVPPAVPTPEPVAPTVEPAPAMPEAPQVENPSVPEPDLSTPTIETPPTPEVTLVQMPEAPSAPTEPVMPTQAPVAPTAPAPEVTPNVVEKEMDFTADKEAFLKACENMFDALVAKFNK